MNETLPAGPFSLIYADPPWSFRDKANAGKRGAAHKYPCMDWRDIARLPVSSIAADDCMLAMWWVDTMPKEAIAIAEMWGFERVKMAGFTWVKTGPELQPTCIEWQAAKDNRGYGRVHDGIKVQFAHRVEWEKRNGPIPDGLFVLHHCDNPSCINIDHLFLGTQADNVRDCRLKGRARGGVWHGSAHPSSKLSEDAVTEIRRLIPLHSRVEIARMFGVSKSLISQIALGQCRKMDLSLPDADLTVGLGHWTRANAENCLFAFRGKPVRDSAAVHQTIVSPRREHSRKPLEARDRLVRLLGDIPRIELFSRDYSPGWVSWGNELPTVAEEVA